MALKDDKPIVNRAQRSRTLTIEMDEMYRDAKKLELDIAPWLWQGIALKEDLFREKLAEHDWEQYEGAYVRVFSSEDAIIPSWAYMLVATVIGEKSEGVFFGEASAFQAWLVGQLIAKLDLDDYQDKRVIVKGCGDLAIGAQEYGAIAARLQPVVRALMFGEPCSTVPIYRKER